MVLYLGGLNTTEALYLLLIRLGKIGLNDFASSKGDAHLRIGFKVFVNLSRSKFSRVVTLSFIA